jgi:hypothetical protein
MQTYSTSICVSERAANKHLTDNFEHVLDDVGTHVHDAVGMVMHQMFHHAATEIKYKDLFDDVECASHEAHHTDL